MGSPIGLDFGAIMAVGTALRADAELLADVLPRVEPIIIDNLCGEPPDEPSE